MRTLTTPHGEYLPSHPPSNLIQPLYKPNIEISKLDLRDNRILFATSFGYAIRLSDACDLGGQPGCGLDLGLTLRDLDAIAPLLNPSALVHSC